MGPVFGGRGAPTVYRLAFCLSTLGLALTDRQHAGRETDLSDKQQKGENDGTTTTN